MGNNNRHYLSDIQENSMPCTGGINNLFNFIRKDEVITYEIEKSRNYFLTSGGLQSASKRHNEIY